MEVPGLSQVLNLDPLRLLEGQAALKSLLSEISGAEIEALLAARNAEGLLLQLAGGRSLVASGDLPFPEGTRLLFRAVPSPDGGLLRLQPLEATPPPPPPVLTPLLQGEALPLLQRLLSDAPLPASLQPLVDLLKATLPSPPPLPEIAASRPPPSNLASEGNVSLPFPSAAQEPASSTPTLTAWPDPPVNPKAPASLPLDIPLQKNLQTYLASRGLSPEAAKAWAEVILETSETLSVLIQESPDAETAAPISDPKLAVQAQESTTPSSALPTKLPVPSANINEETLPLLGTTPLRTPEPSGKPRSSGPQEELLRAQVPEALLPKLAPLLLATRSRSSDGPLDLLFKALFPTATPAPSKPLAPLPSTTPTAAPSSNETGAALKSASTSSAAKAWLEPETWETWLRGTTSALTRPDISPRESPFHALQSREGTAYFELPLPMPHLKGPLELWVEKDRTSAASGDPTTVRILLALEMEGTGPVRLGIERVGSTIRADLWVDEGRKEAIAQALSAEWGDTPPYHLRIRSFQGAQPTLRHLAAGATFGAIG